LQSNEITNSLKPLELAGFKLTILSPSQEKLNKLRDKYSFDKFKSLERQEDELISDAVAQK